MTNTDTPVGIASLGLQLPSLALPVEELARLRGADPDKYTIGLGCHQMALCAPGETVISLAAGAARRALARWEGDPARIGMIAVGTETAVDMSRPLSAWVASELGLQGPLRSYEVKHACYGGTLALRQALEWKLSGAAQGKAALVIASDVALYAEQDPGEPTQGAGAAALVVDDGGIASIDPISFPYSEPAFDFWRPVGQPHPSVDGALSLDCYLKAVDACFGALVDSGAADARLASLDALCMHVPFPKMVKKAALKLGERFGWSEAEAKELLAAKIDPHLEWNRRCGNAYTASLWISVAHALAGRPEGSRVAAFSYGSGFGAELATLTAGPKAGEAAWKADVERDLQDRRTIDIDSYLRLRAGQPVAA